MLSPAPGQHARDNRQHVPARPGHTLWKAHSIAWRGVQLAQAERRASPLLGREYTRKLPNLNRGPVNGRGTPLPAARRAVEWWAVTRSAAAVAFCWSWPLLACACQARPAPLRAPTGQVLALQPGRSARSRSDTMTFGVHAGHDDAVQVRDRASAGSGWRPGDLVTATLVVPDDDAYLAAMRRPATPTCHHRRRRGRAGSRVPEARRHASGHRARRPGRPAVRLSSLAGSAVVVTFIYTRCPLPNFCPLMDSHFAADPAGGQGRWTPSRRAAAVDLRSTRRSTRRPC